MKAPQQFLPLAAALCVLAFFVAAMLSAFGLSGINTVPPGEDGRIASPAAAEPANATQNAMARIVAAHADVAAAPEPVTRAVPEAAAPEATATSDTAAPVVVAALPEPSQALPTEPVAAQNAPESTLDRAPDGDEVVSSIEILDECFVLETCIDHYLFALYQRSTKVDTSKVVELRKVQVKKKKKTVTVTKRFIKLVTQDFSWKDPIAAEKAGMSMMDYVIGGMDRDFKLRLFQGLRAAEKAGLAPGITSGFRDDYRQSIASGLRAAANRSYHGGSLRGGYGHGAAADVVSVRGTTQAQRWTFTESLWKWIDANSTEFRLGRPYLSKDPAHVTPLDGEEYVSRRGTKTQLAATDVKKPNQPVVRNDRAVAKPKGTGRPSSAALKRSGTAGKS